MYESLFPRALEDVEKKAQRKLFMEQIEHLRSEGKSWDEIRNTLCLSDDRIRNLELDVPIH